MKQITIGVVLSVLALVFLSAMNSVAAEPREGLVLYYKFDETAAATITDLSGSGNTGVVKGTPEWIAGPEGMGSGLRFLNSASYIETPDSKSLRPDYITIAVWIRSELTAGSNQMLRKYVWPNLGYLIKVEPLYDYTMLFLFDGALNYGLPIPLVQKDKWEHVAVTFDGQKQIGYLNGELTKFVGQGDAPAVKEWNGILVHSADTPLTIGGIIDFRGAVDEVAIYNRPLDAEEIAEIATEGHIIAVKSAGKLATVWAKVKGQ